MIHLMTVDEFRAIGGNALSRSKAFYLRRRIERVQLDREIRPLLKQCIEHDRRALKPRKDQV